MNQRLRTFWESLSLATRWSLRGAPQRRELLLVTRWRVARILRRYGITRFSFTTATSGISNTTLLISSPQGELVLRIYRYKKKRQAEIAREVHFTEYLQQQGIPVAAVIPTRSGAFFDTVRAHGQEWQVLLMHKAQGAHAKKYTNQLILNLASLQARMHVLGQGYLAEVDTPPRLGMPQPFTDSAEVREARKRVSGASLRLRQRVERALQYSVTFDPQLPVGYIHADFDLGNVLVQDGQVSAVIDFDNLAKAPLVECLGNTLWHVLTITNDITAVHGYLRQYHNVRPLSPAEFRALPKVIEFREHLVLLLNILEGTRAVHEFERDPSMAQRLKRLNLATLATSLDSPEGA
jgi:homoserine kinase type II